MATPLEASRGKGGNGGLNSTHIFYFCLRKKIKKNVEGGCILFLNCLKPLAITYDKFHCKGEPYRVQRLARYFATDKKTPNTFVIE